MQLAFDFCRDAPARPKRPERLFFGLLPDAGTAACIIRFRDRFMREHGLEGVRIGPDRLHVSLHHVGDYGRLRSPLLHATRDAARAVAARPFEIVFRTIRSFDDLPSANDLPRRQPLVLLCGESEGATCLHKALDAALAANGLRRAGHFTPHMTLLYGVTPVPARAVAPICFPVRDFALVHSKLGLTQYDIIDRWPLVPTGD